MKIYWAKGPRHPAGIVCTVLAGGWQIDVYPPFVWLGQHDAFYPSQLFLIQNPLRTNHWPPSSNPPF